MSHPELSSGGGSSLSSGKLSKLLVSVGDATCRGKSDERGMFISVLTFPLHPTAMGIPENPQQAREVLHPRLFAGISPSSPTLLSFPTHCLKAVTTDLGKASSEPRISHPRLQDAELSRALLPFLTLLNLRMFPEKPIFSR